MLAVYIMSGQFQGYYGYLLKTDGRTCEVACRNKIIRVDTSLLEPLDIVMSCSGTLGRYAIIRQEHLPLCLNTSVIRFKPAQCIEDYSFVYGYLSSAEFLNKQEEMACGSVQANFGPTHLKQIKIKVPPKDYRMKYNNVVMPIINMMLKNRSEINMLSSLRDTLLPKLMNGKMKL